MDKHIKSASYTFGHLIQAKDATFGGFVYKITFADGMYYIGSRKFDRLGKWKSYKSSSKYVKAKLKYCKAKFEVLQLEGSTFLASAENKLIAKHINDPQNMNYAIQGHFRQLDKINSHKQIAKTYFRVAA